MLALAASRLIPAKAVSVTGASFFARRILKSCQTFSSTSSGRSASLTGFFERLRVDNSSELSLVVGVDMVVDAPLTFRCNGEPTVVEPRSCLFIDLALALAVPASLCWALRLCKSRNSSCNLA